MVTSGNERVVVITGANEGIGYHMLTALIKDGYRVAGLDIDGTNISSHHDAAPDQVQFYECDVSNTDDMESAITRIITQWNRIDILVNNAAIANVASFEEQTTTETHHEFDVNYFGYVNTIRAVLPHMRARGEGIIHNMSSGTALAGHPGLTGYASTKGAIEGFTRSLQLELQHETVACTLMQPPTSNTQMSAELGYPEWMMNDPAEVGRKLAQQIESTAPVITADWQTKIGLYLIQRFPSLWRKMTDRFVTLDE